MAWVTLLAVAGALVTSIALQDQYAPLIVLSFVGFPLGLIIPPNFQYWFFALGVWGGLDNLPILAPAVLGIAFAICAGFQVAVVRTVMERAERRRQARERAEQLGKDGYSDNPAG